LCVILGFQVGSLHISNGVTYDVKNVLSSLYQMPTTPTKRIVWVVCFGQYKVIGDHVLTHLQKTILTPSIAASLVKAKFLNKNTKHEIENIDIDLQLSDILPSSMFINLFNSSLKEEPPP
jgi:hypothetical protein